MGFLDAIRVDHETAHTRLLAWLLDPREDHELGTRFLRAFWKAAVGDPRAGLNATTVLVEERQDESRADFTLSTDTRYVLVENKIQWSAFRPSQIAKHARSGQGRAKRSGKSFHLVVVVPDKLRHQDRLTALAREYPLKVVDWSNIAKMAQLTAEEAVRPVPAGIAFLLAYADFIERNILHYWRGFNMSLLTPQVVSAASTYIAARVPLMRDLRRFCAAVHEGVESVVLISPVERSERDEGDSILLLRSRYDFKGWRTTVAVSFYAQHGAKSLRGIRMSVHFLCFDNEVIKKVQRRGLRNQSEARKRFGSKATWECGEYLYVYEDVPRNLWLTSDAKLSQTAVTHTQTLLRRYLREVSKLLR